MGLVRAIEMGQERLRHDSLHDALTGLANRVLFSNRVEHALAQRRMENEPLAVLFIDLDDFKTVNDSLGHQAGDELLVEVAKRLRRCVRAGDTPARLGGDEFAVLVEGALSPQDAVHLAERILAALKPPVSLAGREVFVAASVGIAVQPRSQGSAEELLRGADVAMYLAKSKGKGRYELFAQSMYDEVLDRLELKADLQVALERDEFELFYQPIIALSGSISSIEALLRWHHPTRGVVPPAKFIPLAEETGLIVPIGRWVLQQACAQAKGWQERHTDHRHLGVCVNLSVRQLHDQGFVDDVAEALRATRLDPSCLTLEITESMLMADVELGAQRLARLKQLRVKLAIDDFGTGYSSLSYLQRFPVDLIKIDRSFVQEVARDANSSALVRSVVDLAAALSVVTVAEGIEDAEQLVALKALDCQLGQGFYFSKPIAATSLELLLGKPAERVVPASTAPRPRPATAQLLRGDDVLDRLGTALDDLHRAQQVPVMARRPWLSTWVETHPEYDPWPVALWTPAATLDAVALLTAHPTGDALEGFSPRSWSQLVHQAPGAHASGRRRVGGGNGRGPGVAGTVVDATSRATARWRPRRGRACGASAAWPSCAGASCAAGEAERRPVPERPPQQEHAQGAAQGTQPPRRQWRDVSHRLRAGPAVHRPAAR
jgi:diguanylate cyclase (GGDEF)-like protein